MFGDVWGMFLWVGLGGVRVMFGGMFGDVWGCFGDGLGLFGYVLKMFLSVCLCLGDDALYLLIIDARPPGGFPVER